jgi:uncharacterized membrane protein
LALCALCVVQALTFYPLLPEKVASHFGVSGQPDAWSTRASLVGCYLLITGICAILFLGISFGLSKLPPSLINLPNKDHWLSLERRQETFDFLFSYNLWFASATLLLLMDLFGQTFQVALGKAKALPHPMLSLGLYIGFAAAWSIGLYIKFKKK